MRITNGSATFERVRRPADYESAKSGIILAFVIDDDEDADTAIAAAAVCAKRHALAQLASRTETVAPTPVAKVAEVAEVAEVAPPAITDADLNKALQASMDAAPDRSARAAQLRGLVARYTGDPLKKVYAIAADERPGFLAAVAEI